MPGGPPGWPVLPQTKKVSNLQEGTDSLTALPMSWLLPNCTVLGSQMSSGSSVRNQEEASQDEMPVGTYLEKVDANLSTKTKQLLSPKLTDK